MKKIWLLAALLGLSPGLGLAQTMDELLNDGKNTDNVLTQSMGFNRHSYSPLNKINKGNVKRLVPVWSTSLMNDMGELAAPVVYNGVIYAINGKWTFAIDVETGRQIWRTAVELEPGVQRTAITRGAATIYNGKLYRVTIDNHLVALDMKTGKQVWNQRFADWKEGYYATSAPIVANGVLISGMAGGESTTRGFLDGWDPETGNRLWRRYTIPAPGEPGSETWPSNSDAWKVGGVTRDHQPPLPERARDARVVGRARRQSERPRRRRLRRDGRRRNARLGTPRAGYSVQSALSVDPIVRRSLNVRVSNVERLT
jgi:alcohol dehydrogenase (cytochrome c)